MQTDAGGHGQVWHAAGKCAGGQGWQAADPWQVGGQQSGQGHANPRGAAGPRPAPTEGYPVFQIGDNTFETKFAQVKDNQFDGQKGEEQWKSLVGNYLATRRPTMAYIWRWAESRGSNPVTRDEVESFRCWMDEDLHVVDHLLWGFLNLNLTGAAREIFSNTGQSNCL